MTLIRMILFPLGCAWFALVDWCKAIWEESK